MQHTIWTNRFAVDTNDTVTRVVFCEMQHSAHEVVVCRIAMTTADARQLRDLLNKLLPDAEMPARH